MLRSTSSAAILFSIGHRTIMGTDDEPAGNRPVLLDEHRGMRAQKATELRRHLADVEADQAALQSREDELENFLLASPAATWIEAAEKARYLLTLLAVTSVGRDPRRRKLITALLDDFDRLSADPGPVAVSSPRPANEDKKS